MSKRFAKKMLGQVPSSVGVYWHNQEVLMGMSGLGSKVKKWDACDEQLKSFAHMAVASAVGCSWFLDYNYFEVHNRGLDMDKAREVPRWRESEVFTPLERDVMAYAEAMSEAEPTVTDEMVSGLVAQLGEAAVIELTAVIGFANFSTRTNSAPNLAQYRFAEACELKPLAQRGGQPSTIG